MLSIDAGDRADDVARAIAVGRHRRRGRRRRSTARRAPRRLPALRIRRIDAERRDGDAGAAPEPVRAAAAKSSTATVCGGATTTCAALPRRRRLAGPDRTSSIVPSAPRLGNKEHPVDRGRPPPAPRRATATSTRNSRSLSTGDAARARPTAVSGSGSRAGASADRRATPNAHAERGKMPAASNPASPSPMGEGLSDTCSPVGGREAPAVGRVVVVVVVVVNVDGGGMGRDTTVVGGGAQRVRSPARSTIRRRISAAGGGGASCTTTSTTSSPGWMIRTSSSPAPAHFRWIAGGSGRNISRTRHVAERLVGDRPVHVAGEHTMAGDDCRGNWRRRPCGRAPFSPAAREGRRSPARDVGLDQHVGVVEHRSGVASGGSGDSAIARYRRRRHRARRRRRPTRSSPRRPTVRRKAQVPSRRHLPRARSTSSPCSPTTRCW